MEEAQSNQQTAEAARERSQAAAEAEIKRLTSELASREAVAAQDRASWEEERASLRAELERRLEVAVSGRSRSQELPPSEATALCQSIAQQLASYEAEFASAGRSAARKLLDVLPLIHTDMTHSVNGEEPEAHAEG
jgi:hypothetical protein